jgi:hypothetical protein
MQEHPCKQLLDEYLEAMNEWVDSTNVLQSYVSTKPLAPGEDVPMLPLEEYRAASARAEAAFKDYKEKMELYFDCAKKFGPPPK